MVQIPNFEDLPYAVRKSPRKRWNALVKLLNEEESDDVEEVVPPEPVTQNISFTINDGTDAIAGATVTIGETAKTTGSAGGCNFDGIAEGKVNVTVEKEGFASKTEEITVSAESKTFTISLVAVETAADD